jgi:hypothetical protein
MSLAAALDEIRNDLLADPALAAIDQPAQPRDANYDTVTLLLYPVAGAHRLGTADRGNGYAARMAVHTIRCDLVTPRKHLPDDLQRLQAYADAIPNALFAGFVRDRFNDTVFGLGDLSFSHGPTFGSSTLRMTLTDGIWGEGTIGYRYEFEITIEEDIVL